MNRGRTVSWAIGFLAVVVAEDSAHAAGGGPPGILFGETVKEITFLGIESSPAFVRPRGQRLR